ANNNNNNNNAMYTNMLQSRFKSPDLTTPPPPRPHDRKYSVQLELLNGYNLTPQSHTNNNNNGFSSTKEFGRVCYFISLILFYYYSFFIFICYIYLLYIHIFYHILLTFFSQWTINLYPA